MRSNLRTTIATYCLLSIAGGVSFIMPDGLETPPPARPVERAVPTTRPAAEPESVDDDDDGGTAQRSRG